MKSSIKVNPFPAKVTSSQEKIRRVWLENGYWIVQRKLLNFENLTSQTIREKHNYFDKIDVSSIKEENLYPVQC